MSKILCIYPDDSSTRFLDRIQYYLKQHMLEVFHCYKVKPNQESHDRCIARLHYRTEEELVIFLGHGRSDSLYGANNYQRALDSSYDFEGEYENDSFINRDNISVFSGKKIFCLSCNSAEKLGRLAYQNGAKAFIGFGDIPTDDISIPEIGRRLRFLTARFKGEVSWIVKSSLVYSIKNNYDFFQLISLVRLLTNKRINEIIITHKNLRERRLLADYLYNFKNEMELFGDGKEKLLN